MGMIDEIIKAGRREGIDPAFLYAIKKTERVVTETNKHLLTKAELEEWEAAIKEYQAVLN